MKLFLSILIPLLVGALSAVFTQAGVHGWYVLAHKPSYNPPNWLFAPVWTILFILMGIALNLVWKSMGNKSIKKTALQFFTAQLVFNFFWSCLFFYFHRPGVAFAEIIVLWLLILFTIIWFRKISVTAAWLLVPYIFWVSFAAVLNFYIWQHN